METIILKPKDKDELHFFIELAKRLGVKIQTLEDLLDEQLLKSMEENRETPKTSKQSVLNTIQNILNEDKASYK